MNTNSENHKFVDLEKSLEEKAMENTVLKNKISQLNTQISELESQKTTYQITSVLLFFGTFGPVILKHC